MFYRIEKMMKVKLIKIVFIVCNVYILYRMLMVTSILGNLKKDSFLNQKYREYSNKNLIETVLIHRSESEKMRMRKKSTKDTDLGFILPSRTRLRDQDVIFLDETKMILINIVPELVAILNIKNDSSKYGEQNYLDLLNVGIKIGHTIGNLHRPLKLEKNKIIFPIQTMDEIDLFKKFLSELGDRVILSSDSVVFEPDHGFDIHEH